MVLYALGFGLYGFVSSYVLVLVAVAVLTVGEMMTVPVSQPLVSQMAPEAMRGRYMAAYGFSWVIPAALGPTLAGLVMDTTDPRWVWLGTGVVGLLAAWVFLLVRRRAGQSFEVTDEIAGVELGPQGEALERV
jgi:MFS family permease